MISDKLSGLRFHFGDGSGLESNGLSHFIKPENLFDLAGIGLWLFGAGGETTYVNDVIADRLGYSREEMLALPPSACLGDEALAKSLAAGIRHRQNTVERDEVKLIRWDGSELWARVSSVQTFGKEGDFLGTAWVLVDVAERKRLEPAWRESEERYRTILENIHDGYYEVDLGGNLTFANEGLVKMFGIESKEKLLGTSMLRFADERQARRLRETASKVYRTGLPEPSFVYELRQSNGTVRNVDISLSLIKNGDGRPSGFRGILRDVTERRMAEDALRSSEERFAKAFGASPQPKAIFEAPGRRIVNVNEAMARTFGWKAEEMIGRTPADLDIWVDLEQQRRVRALLASQGYVRDLEIKFRTKTGEVREFLYSAETINLNKQPHVLVVASDITERLRAERALQESEERYRHLFEHSFAGISRSTLDGRMIGCNEALARIFGYESSEQMLNVRTQDLYFDQDERRQLVAELERHGSVRNYERRMKRRDGTPVWTMANLTLSTGRNGQAIVEGVILDITERKLIEQKLAQSHAEMRALSARMETVREEERTRIAREIHDDLGQALTGLRLDLSWLDKKLAQTRDEKLRGKVAPRLKEIAGLLEDTIQTVRHIATELRPGVLDTLGLGAAIDWQAREFARRGGMRCELRLCRDPQSFPVDRASALFRIFQEILTNIARHARAEQFAVEMVEADGQLVLTVRDRGIGISEERLRDPRSLGLIGMRERALIFGGSVRIEGEPGVGTTVCVIMPIGG